MLGTPGQLGGDLVDEGARQGLEMVGRTQWECDITDGAAVERAIAEVRPDAVINGAAWTQVDAAEEHEAEAEAVNATGAGLVAAACASAGIRCCHVSTDYVFDGTATAPIPEDAVASPRSAYGRTKWHGEVAVRERCPDHLIVRTSWLYGRQGPNFVLTMLRLAAERPELRVVADQHGAPTWTGHLAPAMLRLVGVAPPGTYHLTNSGVTTWYELRGRDHQCARPSDRGGPDHHRRLPGCGRAPGVLGARQPRMARARRAAAARLAGGVALLPRQSRQRRHELTQSSGSGRARLSALTYRRPPNSPRFFRKCTSWGRRSSGLADFQNG